MLIERLVGIVGNALDYRADAAYAEYLNDGLMPHSKLRKHMSLSVRPLAQLVALAVERGLILKQTRRDRPYPVTVYTLPSPR